MQKNNNLYTIIMDFRGGTYIFQKNVTDKNDAIKLWLLDLDVKKIKYFSVKTKEDLLNQIKDEELTPIENNKNVWISNYYLNGHFTTIHLIKTFI